ncbi:MAG TPA: hypothetical protein VGC93_08770 [Thermoanaerobaculia bacterium]
MVRGMESMAGLRPALEGEMVLRWGGGEETALRPEICLSGDRANFRGVDLLAPPYVVRVVAEPLAGLGVVVIDTESDRRPVFRSSSCAVLRGDVQRGGWRVNDIWDVSGYVEVDCRLTSGEELEGKISFAHCH